MAYAKPAKYHTAVRAGARGYNPNNGYVSGAQAYGPKLSNQVLTLTISAGAPANGSQYVIPDGPGNNPSTPVKTFTFTYSGSPGAGIIPLVAGGGTVAQAATAAQVAMSAQLANWTVTNPSAAVLVLSYNPKGVNPPTSLSLVGNTHTAIQAVSASSVLPGRMGKLGCTLSG